MAKTQTKTPFEIHIDQQDSAVQSGMVPIRWCLDPAMFKEYTSEDIKKMMLLVVVIPKNANRSGKKEQRKLVPVLDLMTYIEFRSPGENVVFAAVLEPKHGKENLQNALFQKRYGDYETDVFTYAFEEDENGYTIAETMKRNPSGFVKSFTVMKQMATVGVDVPEECFAKPAPQWEQNFVNAFWRDLPIDQCDYRRRRMIAYSTAIPVLAFKILTRLVSLIVLYGLLKKNVNPKPLWNLFSLDLEDIWNRSYGSHLTVGDFTHYQFSPLAFSIVYIGLLLNGQGAGASIGYAVVGLITLTIVMAMAGGLLYVIANAKDWWDEFRMGLEAYEEELAKKRLADKDAEQKRLEAMKAALTCAGKGMNGTVGLGAIPREYRTFRLRFLDLKAKVCKPFAR